jgi:hypothetical protein
MSGNDLKSARRSLNILFSEWGNRGLHYWEIAANSVTLIENQNEYIFTDPRAMERLARFKQLYQLV